MIIITLSYNRPQHEVDALREAHLHWLHTYYQQGLFLASGRKHDQQGGVILACDMSEDKLQRIIAEDPFTAVAEYKTTAVNITNTHENLNFLKGI